MIKQTRAAVLLTASALLLFGGAQAAEPEDPQIQHIRKSLAVFLPNLQIDRIAPAPIDGLYEVAFDSRLMYVSADGRYIVQGAVFDLEAQQDLTKPRLNALRAEAVEAIGEQNMLVYEPKKVTHQVTVFTDIDCPYCRKMHAQMDEYLDRGIRFRYLFYPRAGKNSSSYDKAVAVWCADDRRAAMDRAKAGDKLDKASCDNPVDAHMALAEKLPIRGTPALVLDSGEIIPGYIPPERLIRILDDKDKK